MGTCAVSMSWLVNSVAINLGVHISFELEFLCFQDKLSYFVMLLSHQSSSSCSPNLLYFLLTQEKDEVCDLINLGKGGEERG